MGIEIERKFLINKEEWGKIDKLDKKLYRQGYVLTGPGKTVRIRTAGEEGFITLKGASVGLAKPEFEYAIPKKDAEQMQLLFCNSIVSKWRYRVWHEGKLWEVDEFLEDNDGLLVAEIELKTEDEQFSIPDWVLYEVTTDKRYSNSNLSINPYKNWKPVSS